MHFSYYIFRYSWLYSDVAYGGSFAAVCVWPSTPAAAWYWFNSVQKRRQAPALDKSFVQGVPGRVDDAQLPIIFCCQSIGVLKLSIGSAHL